MFSVQVTVGKDIDNKYDLKKERAPRSPKSKTDVMKVTLLHISSIVYQVK